MRVIPGTLVRATLYIYAFVNITAYS